MPTDAILNQYEPNVILTAHATKVNRTEPYWTEPQTCLACKNHAFNNDYSEGRVSFLDHPVVRTVCVMTLPWCLQTSPTAVSLTVRHTSCSRRWTLTTTLTIKSRQTGSYSGQVIGWKHMGSKIGADFWLRQTWPINMTTMLLLSHYSFP